VTDEGEGGKVKQRVLALAIRRIIWAELALSAAIAAPAFAQSQPAANSTGSDAAAAAPAAASSATTTQTAQTTQTTQPAVTSENGSNVAQLKKFEVTGSLIRQSDKTGFQAVQTITAQQIQQSGATTVSDFLRTLSANSANSWGEANDDSFAAGASGIALRGLSEKYTLVLIDGQRVAPFGFAVNGTDTFVDLNTIPLNAVDRIEVVKTGAVSQYGSDAIAGVVNIITKHDFQGLQLDGSYGGATQGGQGTTKVGILAGFGNLTSDRFNVTATASYYKANGFTLADRDTTQNQDFSNQPYGGSILAPSYWINPTTGLAQALGPCTGTVQPFGSNIIAADTGAASGGTVCGHNTAESGSIDPWTERWNAKVHADFKINDNTTAWADLWESNITSVTNDFASYLGNETVYNPATGTLSAWQALVPGSNPYNPFGTTATLFTWLPNTLSDTTQSNFYRAATGVKGNFSISKEDWDWALSYGHSQSTVTNTYGGELSVAGVDAMLANGTYNFANPSATPNGLNGVFTDTNNIAVSKLDVIDATLSTPNLFHLPTGDVGLGLGSQFMHESERIDQGANTMDGDVLNPALQTVDGERNVAAVYYQVDIPLWQKMLTFSQSGRYDHYSDFGGAFSPRYALRFQPIQQFTMYGSFNRGFRAPSFVENTHSTSTGISPVGPNGEDETVVTTGNTSLQPERTKNYNIGFQLSPARGTDIGFDWYKIHVDHAIGAVVDPSKTVYNPDGSIAYMVEPYQNLGSFDTSGFETTFRQSVDTKIGRFTLSGDWAYVWHFVMNGIGSETGSVDGAGNDATLAQPFGGSFPRWKGTTDLNWDWHKWDATLEWQYIGPYSDALGLNYSTASYSQFNLNVSYKGFKNWTIYGGMNNIFNRAPPYDPLWVNQIDQTGYDQSLYNYVGRFLQIGATYKF
jgi:iron complex outermembrane recepter protein